LEAGRWERIQELFDAAAALDSDAQARYLEAACAGDEDLLREAHIAPNTLCRKEILFAQPQTCEQITSG
jgi:hypothetical protein